LASSYGDRDGASGSRKRSLLWCRLDVSTSAPMLAFRAGVSEIRLSIRRSIRRTADGATYQHSLKHGNRIAPSDHVQVELQHAPTGLHSRIELLEVSGLPVVPLAPHSPRCRASLTFDSKPVRRPSEIQPPASS